MNLTKILSSLLAVCILASLAGCGSKNPASQNSGAGNADTASDTITQEFSFESMDADAVLEEIPETIEYNGAYYRRDTTIEPVYERTRNAFVVTDTYIVEDLTERKPLPEQREFEIAGKKVVLTLSETTYEGEEGGREETASQTFSVNSATPAKTREITYTDASTGEKKTATGELADVASAGTSGWTSAGTVTCKFIATDDSIDTFMLGNTEVTYNPASPTWTGYENQILAALGYSANTYKISGGKWVGNGGYENDKWVRSATYALSKKGAVSYSATYEYKYTVAGGLRAIGTYTGNADKLGVSADDEHVRESYSVIVSVVYNKISI